MNSIRTKITLLTVCTLIAALSIAADRTNDDSQIMCGFYELD